jgi:hypothetical protein
MREIYYSQAMVRGRYGRHEAACIQLQHAGKGQGVGRAH